MLRKMHTQFVVFAITLLLTGCGSGVSTDNFEKIKSGMTLVEVERILGRGEEEVSSSVEIPEQSVSLPGVGSVSMSSMASSGNVVKWQDGNKVITIMFLDGKVVSKTKIGF